MKQHKTPIVQLEKKPEYLSRVRKDVLRTFVSFFFEEYWDNIDFEPNFQRGLVWSQKQKEAYILALFEHRAELSPTFVLDQDKVNETMNLKKMISIDGKQRLHAVKEFMDDKFSVKGMYYNQLKESDKFYLQSLDFDMVVYRNPDVSKTLDYKTQLEIFLAINSWGVPQAEEHIKKLEEEYSELSQ